MIPMKVYEPYALLMAHLGPQGSVPLWVKPLLQHRVWGLEFQGAGRKPAAKSC